MSESAEQITKHFEVEVTVVCSTSNPEMVASIGYAKAMGTPSG